VIVQGNVITAMNPAITMDKNAMAVKELAETSMDMWEAFEEKTPLRKMDSSELKKALERANKADIVEGLFTPFAKAFCPH